MKNIYIGEAFDPKNVIINENKTINEIYRENGIAIPYGAIITLNSRRLGDADLDRTLRDLGVRDNDIITLTQKLVGAR